MDCFSQSDAFSRGLLVVEGSGEDDPEEISSSIRG